MKFDGQLFYRTDGRVELICEHGVGHPSKLLHRGTWHEYDSIHGCDGCCGDEEFTKVEAIFHRYTKE